MIYIIEGMDNCLKDTIIQLLRKRVDPNTQVLKYSSPPQNHYQFQQEEYQKLHFTDMFELLFEQLNLRKRTIILNRAHLGELVYSPVYRGYSGDWVLELERNFISKLEKSELAKVYLVLLFDSNNEALRNREDGKSFSNVKVDNLNRERKYFLEAFEKSLFVKKFKFDISQFSALDGKVDTNAILDRFYMK